MTMSTSWVRSSASSNPTPWRRSDCFTNATSRSNAAAQAKESLDRAPGTAIAPATLTRRCSAQCRLSSVIAGCRTEIRTKTGLPAIHVGMKSSLFWVTLATALVVARPLQAELLWWGDPSKGTMVFKNFGGDGNCGTGTISTLADPTHGMVFKYEKPGQSNRCENHGIRINGEPYVFQNNATYYIAWHSKLSSTANNNANFQWKSYENHSQNFPIVLKMIGGQMSLMYTPPGGGSSILWRRALLADTWHHYVLGIKTSSELRGGTIEFWFDGTKQMLSGAESYAGRTFDSKNCPKWGAYGGRGSPMTNLVADLRIATTSQEVPMGSRKPGEGPAGAPTDGGRPDDAGMDGSDVSAPAGASPPPAVGSGGSGPAGTGGAGGGSGDGGSGGLRSGGKDGAPSPMGIGRGGSAEA